MLTLSEAFVALFDVNQDGMMNADELKRALTKHSKDVNAEWTDERITTLIAQYDLDKNGLPEALK